jgi:hypothetical protein
MLRRVAFHAAADDRGVKRFVPVTELRLLGVDASRVSITRSLALHAFA